MRGPLRAAWALLRAGQVIVCYTEAVKTVVPAEATGKPQALWLDFARFYEDHGDPASARLILGRAVDQPYKVTRCFSRAWGRLCAVPFGRFRGGGGGLAMVGG